MNESGLTKLRGVLASMRRKQVAASEVERVAKQLGRVVSKRGKHPMWVSEEFLDLWPLSIPHHGSSDLSVSTRNSILNQLEDDIMA